MTIEKNKAFIELLDIISNFNSLNDPTYLYLRINNFITSKLDAHSMIVYAFPFKLYQKSKKMFFHHKLRINWCKNSEYKIIYKENLLHQLVKKFWDKADQDDGHPIILDEQAFYCHYIGDDGEQCYFALFSTKNKKMIDVNLYRYLCKFWSNSFQQAIEWKRINNLNSLVHIDDVTGLYNQRKLYKDLEKAIDSHTLTGEEFIVLFIDVDNFKNVNDGHGHLVGSFLLKQLASVIRDEMRKEDLIYRYGGDEFVIIIPCQKSLDANSIGERLLATVKKHVFHINKETKYHLTISIGAAKYPQNAKNRNEILAMADQMMYQAKAEGRGRVCMAHEIFNKGKTKNDNFGP